MEKNQRIVKLSEQDREKANEILAFSLIKLLYQNEKISEKIFTNIEKECRKKQS